MEIRSAATRSLPMSRPKGPESLPMAFLAAFASTTAAYAVVDVWFANVASNFNSIRQVRTNFAFSPPSACLIEVLVCWLVAAAIVQSRSWIVPIGIGIFLTEGFLPGYGWSGPGNLLHAIMPLIETGTQMVEAAFLINAAMILAWMTATGRFKKMTND